MCPDPAGCWIALDIRATRRQDYVELIETVQIAKPEIPITTTVLVTGRTGPHAGPGELGASQCRYRQGNGPPKVGDGAA
jgi:hypothetical protein